jgi:hypothetical protein
MEYYLVVKRNELPSYKKRWKGYINSNEEVTLERLLTKRSQLYDVMEKAKLWRQLKTSVVAKDWEGWVNWQSTEEF